MPIQVKTMRDVWDRGKKGAKETKKYKIFPPEFEENRFSSSPFAVAREFEEDKSSSLPFAVAREIEKHYLDYLARKKAFLETKEEIAKTFADYERHLGDAGFSKI